MSTNSKELQEKYQTRDIRASGLALTITADDNCALTQAALLSVKPSRRKLEGQFVLDCQISVSSMVFRSGKHFAQAARSSGLRVWPILEVPVRTLSPALVETIEHREDHGSWEVNQDKKADHDVPTLRVGEFFNAEALEAFSKTFQIIWAYSEAHGDRWTLLFHFGAATNLDEGHVFGLMKNEELVFAADSVHEVIEELARLGIASEDLY